MNPNPLTTPAILLRRIPHGEFDLIVTLLTLSFGKMPFIAKYAKKSAKRFAGALELFSVLNVVFTKGRGGLPILQEASLTDPYFNIRSDIVKTAYASYWAEIIIQWIEEGKAQPRLYHLLKESLDALDRGEDSQEALSIAFQLRFLTEAGLFPCFTQCTKCQTDLEKIISQRIPADFRCGGIVCPDCNGDAVHRRHALSKGTLKQLLWAGTADDRKAKRLRLTAAAISEGTAFLESFVGFHLGKELKSLKFLRSIRKS